MGEPVRLTKPEPVTVTATGTTKRCPQCSNTMLARISTQGFKFCTDCHIRIKWVKEAHLSDYI